MSDNGSKERRKRLRVPLRWIARLKRPASDREIRTETHNLSSEGFYCVSPEIFEPGESIECAIGLPLDGSRQERNLSCRCTVLRTERIGDALFGVACRIDDYTASSGAVH
jgi:PilZ domain